MKLYGTHRNRPTTIEIPFHYYIINLYYHTYLNLKLWWHGYDMRSYQDFFDTLCHHGRREQ